MNYYCVKKEKKKKNPIEVKYFEAIKEIAKYTNYTNRNKTGEGGGEFNTISN